MLTDFAVLLSSSTETAFHNSVLHLYNIHNYFRVLEYPTFPGQPSKSTVEETLSMILNAVMVYSAIQKRNRLK